MSDDPFGNDRTIIKPAAGRAAAAPAAASAPVAAALPELPPGASLNPLVACALPLLAAAPRIRQMVRHPDPAALKASLAAGVQAFETAARARGLPNDQVVAGRYILCTLLDEAAASTPWGGSGAWSGQSLLVQFHNESWGGEKVFQLLARLAEDVNGNRALLELLYVALAFGFEGRYRVLDNGRAQLDGVRARLAQMLRQGHDPDPALSPRWQGAPGVDARLAQGVPVWVVAAVTGVLLLGTWAGMRWSLAERTDAVFAGLQQLQVAQPVKPAAPAVTRATPGPKLAELLREDIAAGRLLVRDEPSRSVVVVGGDSLFTAGSAQVEDPALVARIGAALKAIPGAVAVSGHTDAQPMRSARFPSNWHLSLARAEAVRGLLAAAIEPARLRAEGRADADPVADDATAEGRARNRRVEISLLLQGQS